MATRATAKKVNDPVGAVDSETALAQLAFVAEPSRTGRGTRVSKSRGLEAGLEFARKQAEEALARTRREVERRVLQDVLPLWDDDNRGIPNPLIRSGLFTVGNSEERKYVDKVLIHSLSNYQITYSGQELQQDDLSVWMALINMARGQAIADSIFFTGYRIIKDLGWRMHSETYKRVQASIQRLKVTGLTIHSPGKDKGYSGSLIREYAWTETDLNGNSCWMVRFEPRVIDLFQDDTTTFVEWETRKRIGTRATLALWLHAFYTSHTEPYPISVEKMHELCGSSDTLSSFRRNVRLALERLVKEDFLSSYDVKNDLVHVVKLRRGKLKRVA
jgi:hypothetical protein